MFRLIYLTNENDSGIKFFEILQRNSRVTLRSGENETSGVSDHKSFESVKLANVFVRKMLADKKKCGFVKVNEAMNDFGCIKGRNKIVKSTKSVMDVHSSEDNTEAAATANFHQNFTFVTAQIKILQQNLESIDEKRKLLSCGKQKFISVLTDVGRVVSLNIGGKVLNVCRELVDLHQEEGNLFALLSGRYDHLFPKDRNGRVFLDLDHHWVTPIINLARDMTMWDGIDEKSRPRLSCDSLYLSGMSVMGHDTSSSRDESFTAETDSEILKSLKTVNFIDVLPAWLGENKYITLKLLFRGSRDGFTAKAFHAKCDTHKETISIIRDTNNCVFGGYADKARSTTKGYVSSDKAFLFSLKRGGREAAKQFKIVVYKNNAIYNDSSYLCVFGGGHDLAVEDSCNINDRSRSRKMTYDLDEDTVTIGTHFKVAEIEVFEIIYHENPPIIQSVQLEDNSMSVLEANVSLYGDYFQELLHSVNQMMSELRHHQNLVIAAEDELLSEATAFREELKFVAKFAAIDLSSPEKHLKDKKSDLETFERVLHDIEAIVKIMTEYRADSNTDVNFIVYINMGGTVLAVSKAALLQAPCGSILANMASDVWGHDLDSEGNIIQDVNPELFRLIIAHLRLKTLLQREDRMSEVPPISVYEDQKAAMENLLAFYAMSEVPLKVLKRGG